MQIPTFPRIPNPQQTYGACALFLVRVDEAEHSLFPERVVFCALCLGVKHLFNLVQFSLRSCPPACQIQTSENKNCFARHTTLDMIALFSWFEWVVNQNQQKISLLNGTSDWNWISWSSMYFSPDCQYFTPNLHWTQAPARPKDTLNLMS